MNDRDARDIGETNRRIRESLRKIAQAPEALSWTTYVLSWRIEEGIRKTHWRILRDLKPW